MTMGTFCPAVVGGTCTWDCSPSRSKLWDCWLLTVAPKGWLSVGQYDTSDPQATSLRVQLSTLVDRFWKKKLLNYLVFLRCWYIWIDPDLGDPGVVGLLAPRLNNGDLKGAAIRPRVGHIGNCDSRTTCHPTWRVLVKSKKYETGVDIVWDRTCDSECDRLETGVDRSFHEWQRW